MPSLVSAALVSSAELAQRPKALATTALQLKAELFGIDDVIESAQAQGK